MGTKAIDASQILTRVVEKLSNSNQLETITQTVAEAARQLSGADGATFVLRDDNKCYYADENAISPLWKGKRFAAELCISGWCMINRKVVVIQDIYQDPRIPVDAYRPTFVKSLCVVPIRAESPIGAIGIYWSTVNEPSAEDIKLLQVLANSSAVALENLELRNSIQAKRHESENLTSKHKELESYIHSLAHDLKSPLATMMGMAELLQMRAKSSLDDKSNRYVNSILTTGSRLSRQIDRVLTLYRLANKSICKQRVDLSSMARELVEDLKCQYADREIHIEIADGVWADADPDLIRMVLENFLSNAFKYTGKTAVAEIRFGAKAGPEGEQVIFVSDNGAGFDSSQAGQLFQPWTRLHQDSEFEGTGLGLASVSRIIMLHGGKVMAEGKPGHGAVFSFCLPNVVLA